MTYSPLKRMLAAGFVLVTGLTFAQTTARPSQEIAADMALNEAGAALKRHDFTAAIRLYKDALIERPQDQTALLGLANAYYYSHQPKPAVENYQKLLQLNPGNWQANLGLGEVLNYEGRYTDAENHLRAAARQQPGNQDIAWALSRTYIYENQFAKSSELLQDSLRQHSNDYRLWESLGEAELKQDHTVEARRDLQRALTLNPNAVRSQRLLSSSINSGGGSERTGFHLVEFHDYAYLQRDGLGNNVFSSPQQLTFGYGDRWQSRFTGQYQRLGFSPAGGESVGAANLALLTDHNEFKINQKITLEAGGGTAQYFGLGMSRPIYDAGAVIRPLSNLRLSAHYGQQIVAPTFTAATLGITRRGWNTGVNYKWKENTIALDYYQDDYRDSNFLRGGAAEFRHRVWHGPVDVSVGYQGQGLSFSKPDLFHGYFSPKRFIAHNGIVNVSGRKGRLRIDYDFALGRETYTRPVITNPTPLTFVLQRRSSLRGYIEARNSFDLNRNLALNFSFLSFHTALSSGSGSFNANAFLFGITRRF